MNMRKIKFSIITLIIILLIIITAIIVLNFNNKSEKNNISTDIEGYTLRCGYIEKIKKNHNKFIIKTDKELNGFLEKYCEDSDTKDYLIDKYNKDFFKNQSLAIVYIELTSGSSSVEFVEANVIGSKVSIKYKTGYIGSHMGNDIESGIGMSIGTCDMSGCFIVVNVPKNVHEVNCT